jgi:hypothetical protein
MPIITFTTSTVFLFTSSSIPNDNCKGEIGFINKAMLVKYLSTDELDNSIFNISGPTGILKAMQKLLQDDLYIPKSKNKDRRIYWLLNKCDNNVVVRFLELGSYSVVIAERWM